MRIGEIAKQTGFSKDTLRWYEKIGLIKLDKKARGRNNFREYNQEDLERLIAIRQIKNLGFTLKEIEEFLLLDELEELKCDLVEGMVNEKIQAIEEKIESLSQLKTKLSAAIVECRGDCKEVLYR